MRRFVETCEAVAATTRKTEKIRIVSEYLKALSLDDAARAWVFLTGRAFPRREESPDAHAAGDCAGGCHGPKAGAPQAVFFRQGPSCEQH